MTSWNVSDWSYTAEGGKHAILQYSPSSATATTTTDNDEFYGHVLRIAKSDLASAFHVINEEESTSTSCNHIIDDQSASQLFQKNVIQPLIGRQYIDIGRTVQLPISFCSQLYQQTISSGLIPNARLSSWQKKNCDCGCISNSIEKVIVALLLRDYTVYLSPPPLSAASQLQTKSTSKMFSIEIKPKAGYITTSPLVLPNHRCKYQNTRFTLQQELMRLGVIQKGWQQQQTTNEDGGFTPSQYSPLNLFSNDINQIHNAISDLMNNMQNNLRIWYDGKQIFGLGSDVTLGLDDCQMILNDLLGGNDNSKPATINTTTLLDAVTRIVSTILHQEQKLLSNILSIQQLDVIDGDGAVMIYERLVQLCNGSNVEVEALLDEALLVVSSDEFAVDAVEKQHDDCYITESSPYIFPHRCKSLRNLLDEIEKFDKYMRDHHLQNKEGKAVHDYGNNSNLDESIVNTAHIKSMEHVNHLSKEGCMYLLQNWLLSLVLCDISFFITFRVVSIDDDQEVVTKCQSDDQSGIKVCLLPTKNDAPSTHSSSSSSSSVAIQYEVKVVDCDPKPAKKFCGRKEVENKFSAI